MLRMKVKVKHVTYVKEIQKLLDQHFSEIKK